jgi:hypothetical protein
MAESAINATIVARLEEARAIAAANGAYPEHLAFLDREIEARKRIASASSRKEALDANDKAAKEAAKDWEKASDDINRALTDALMRSFESGESFGDAFIKNLKNTFKTAALKLVIQTVVGGAGSSLGLTGGSSSGNALSSLFGLGGSGTGTGGSSDNMIGSLATSAVKAAATYFGDSIATGLGTGTSLSGQSLVAAQGAYKDAGSFVVDGLSYNGPEIANNLGAGSEFASGALATIGGALSAYTFGAKYGEKYGTAGGTVAGVAAGAGTTAIGGAAAGALGMSAAGAAAGGGVAGATAGASAALAAIPVWGWAALAVAALAGAMGGAKGGPKVRLGTSFDANEFGTIANSEVRRGGTKYGGGQGYDQYIYDDVVRGLVSEIAPDTNIRARLSSVLDPQGDSKNQNQSYVMENGETIYSKRSESGRGQGDWDKFATIEISRMRLAIVTEAMKDAGGNYKAIADLLISPVHDLSAVLGSMSAETMNDAVIGLSNMLFAVDQFEKALGQDIDLNEAIATANATIKTTTDAQGKAVTETTIAALGRVMNETAAVAGVFDKLGMSITESFPAAKIFTLSDSFVQLFGTLDGMNQSVGAYYANFYSQEEQRAQAMEDMGKSFDALNLTMPTTREGFRAVVDGLDLATVGGQATFKAMMDLQGVFANLVPAIDSSATSVEALAAAAKELADWKTNTLSQFAPAKTAAQAAQEVNAAGLYGSPGALMTNMDLAGFNAAIVEVVTGANDATRLLFEGQADNLTIIQDYLTGIGDAAEQAAIDQTQGELDALIATFGDLAGAMAEINPASETLVDAWRRTKTELSGLVSGLAEALGEMPAPTALDNLKATLGSLASATKGISSIDEQIYNLRTGAGDQAAIDLMKSRESSLFADLATSADPGAVSAELASTMMQRISAEAKLATKGLDDVARLEKDGRDLRIKSLQDQISATERLVDFTQSLKGFVADLKFSDLSALNPTDQLGAAQANYSSILDLAKAGDDNARGNLQGSANSYLQEAQGYYGGATSQYADIYGSVISQLGDLSLTPVSDISLMTDQLTALQAIETSSAAAIDTTGPQIIALESIRTVLNTREDQLEARAAEDRAAVQAQIELLRTTVANQETQIRQQTDIYNGLVTVLETHGVHLEKIVKTSESAAAAP